MADPIVVTADVRVPATALTVHAVRASGPGGQNVNKVATKIALRVDLPAIEGLPDDARTRLYRLGLINWFSGVALTGGACTTFRLVDCNLSTNVVGGIGVTIATSVNAVDVLLRDVYIVGPTAGAQCAAGVQITNAGDLTLEHVEVVKCGTGFNIQPGAGQIIQALYCTDSFFDSCSGTGVQFNMQGTGTIQLAKFVNCWSVTNANGFVLSASSAGTCTNAEFINCIGSNNVGGVGFQIVHSGVTNTNVIGGSYALNAYGVYINTSVTRFNLMGVRIGASGQFGNNTINGLVLAKAALVLPTNLL